MWKAVCCHCRASAADYEIGPTGVWGEVDGMGSTTEGLLIDGWRSARRRWVGNYLCASDSGALELMRIMKRGVALEEMSSVETPFRQSIS